MDNVKFHGSEKVKELSAQIMELRIVVEASLNFPEEEINFLKDLIKMFNHKTQNEIFWSIVKNV